MPKMRRELMVHVS